MLDAVFISDLHCHPNEPAITDRFNQFIEWALTHTRTVYVLGDLFHVWAGDDCMEPWALSIAQQFHRLVDHGINVYFMPGNRDFLIGPKFAKLAGFKIMADPCLIQLPGQAVMLAHGDAYCLLDKSHQRFRRVTRNAFFIRFVLALPQRWRHGAVMKVRKKSQENHAKVHRSPHYADVVPSAFLKDLDRYQVNTIIHGHTHKPGLTEHTKNNQIVRQYVLSDWDDNPQVLCYDQSKGFEFTHVKWLEKK